MNILTYLLAAPVVRGPYKDVRHVFKVHANCPFTGSVERALWSGFHADRIGYAFIGGYTSALAKLVSTVEQLDRPLSGRVCLAATESGGGHPKAIKSRLDKQGGALVLNGEKTFATLAMEAEEMLVVASRGQEAEGKNRLRVVRVKPTAKGVTMTARPETPFTPEIPHAIVKFEDVIVENEDVLPGDGYDQYLKPFRTIEDTHVLAATVGYLAGAGRTYGFSREVSAECVSLALSLIDIGAREATKPLTHVVLAGIFASAKRFIGALGDEWAKAEQAERDRWFRDLAILMVAEGVRAKRTERAFDTVVTPSQVPGSGPPADAGTGKTGASLTPSSSNIKTS